MAPELYTYPWESQNVFHALDDRYTWVTEEQQGSQYTLQWTMYQQRIQELDSHDHWKDIQEKIFNYEDVPAKWNQRVWLEQIARK